MSDLMYTYTPAEVLDADATDLACDLSEGGLFRYLPTDAEVQALRWIGHRYGISGVLLDSLSEGDDGAHVMTLCPIEITDTLADDGCDRVPCLPDDTALQRIVWSLAPCL